METHERASHERGKQIRLNVFMGLIVLLVTSEGEGSRQTSHTERDNRDIRDQVWKECDREINIPLKVMNEIQVTIIKLS